jgi:hypothetical protein
MGIAKAQSILRAVLVDCGHEFSVGAIGGFSIRGAIANAGMYD